ncbi:sulfate ABC transporter permease subunit CysT [Nevskia sp.]|uniref:sulfate ABC transporter permease subunit CysT n=1 Tax=Nevskia sp. TaxID=1929292 RepID=UPI003F71E31A
MTATALPRPRRARRTLPGLTPTLGFTIFYLGLIVLIPLAGVFFRASGLGLDGIWKVISDERVLAALKLSFGAAAIAAVLNAVFGSIVAWVFVRYEFPGKRLLDAVIDLPFALPTAVAGIALTALYSESGWIGSVLAQAGVKVAYTPLGVIVAMTFIGLPFVVRTVEPVLKEVERDLEEAAATLGAHRLTTVLRVIAPAVFPSLVTGFALAFARAVGEYGSVIFIAGNFPMVSEIAPLLIIIKLEEFDYQGATAVAATMLVLSFLLLLAINLLQARARRKS